MATIAIEKLIKKLKEKDPKQEVEFIVCRTDGAIVCMNVERNAQDIIKLLKAMA